MPTFVLGPAQGEILEIERAPRFIRVCQNGPCFRVLDQPGHEPEETELIYVYQLEGRTTEEPDLAAAATYHYLPEQPADRTARSTPAWCGWTKQQLQLRRQASAQP